MAPSVMCFNQKSNPKPLSATLTLKLFSFVQSVDFSGNIKIKIIQFLNDGLEN